MEEHDRRLDEARETLRLAEQARESARLSGDLAITGADEGPIVEAQEHLRELENALSPQAAPRVNVFAKGGALD